MVILKYELMPIVNQVIPIGNNSAIPIAVAEQDGKLMMWAQVYENDFKSRQAYIHVNIVGTGIPFTVVREYIGTVVMKNGYVWHVYAGVDYEPQ